MREEDWRREGDVLLYVKKNKERKKEKEMSIPPAHEYFFYLHRQAWWQVSFACTFRQQMRFVQPDTIHSLSHLVKLKLMEHLDILEIQ